MNLTPDGRRLRAENSTGETRDFAFPAAVTWGRPGKEKTPKRALCLVLPHPEGFPVNLRLW